MLTHTTPNHTRVSEPQMSSTSSITLRSHGPANELITFIKGESLCVAASHVPHNNRLIQLLLNEKKTSNIKSPPSFLVDNASQFKWERTNARSNEENSSTSYFTTSNTTHAQNWLLLTKGLANTITPTF